MEIIKRIEEEIIRTRIGTIRDKRHLFSETILEIKNK